MLATGCCLFAHKSSGGLGNASQTHNNKIIVGMVIDVYVVNDVLCGLQLN